MRTDGFHELDVVRVKHAISDTDAYTLEPVSVPAGKIGTVVVGEPGDDSYDVEFLLERPNGSKYSAVVIIGVDNLEATH